MLNILFGRNGKNIIIFGLISIGVGLIFYVSGLLTESELIITYFKSFSFRADYVFASTGLFFVLFGWVRLRLAKKQKENDSLEEVDSHKNI